jgi:hypothetical protein
MGTTWEENTPMIPNDPKLTLHQQLSFQSGLLILSHLGALVVGPEKDGTAVFPITPPGFHLLQFAARLDNLNGIHSIKLGNDFAPVRPVAPKISTRGLLWSVSQSACRYSQL